MTPTHTPVDLTDEQRANLAKLAAKHTRGPWSVDGPLPGSDNPNLGLWDVEGGTNVCCGATLADAHLIAAAPDLLTALVDLEHYLRNTPHHNSIEAAAARKAIAQVQA